MGCVEEGARLGAEGGCKGGCREKTNWKEDEDGGEEMSG